MSHGLSKIVATPVSGTRTRGHGHGIRVRSGRWRSDTAITGETDKLILNLKVLTDLINNLIKAYFQSQLNNVNDFPNSLFN